MLREPDKRYVPLSYKHIVRSLRIIITNSGYIGLYGGLDVDDIHKKRILIAVGPDVYDGFKKWMIYMLNVRDALYHDFDRVMDIYRIAYHWSRKGR
ncbi:MAG: hypothetical protein IKZ65_00220 [Lachnospiraceae bacterium]|nr:hypothetical protein [Lachnospiraceae bacterium]